MSKVYIPSIPFEGFGFNIFSSLELAIEFAKEREEYDSIFEIELDSNSFGRVVWKRGK